MRHLLAATLASLVVGASASAQTTYTFSTQAGQLGQPANNNNNTPPPPGTATLRGHVVSADSGQPIRKAQVRIFAGEIRENRLATTDADGRYEFKEVRAGRYTISVNK